MDFIDDFCKKNSIVYYIMYGTLLGAARHKGFIPWDDDIDIVMFRNDYDRFVELMKKQESVIGIIGPDDKGYYLPFSKVYHKKSVLYEMVTKPIKLGIYIDVFPIDYCGNTIKESCIVMKKNKRLQNWLDAKNMTINKSRSFFKNAVLLFLKLCAVFITKKRIINQIIKNALIYKSTPKKYVSSLCLIVYKEKAVFDKQLFGKGVLLEFEKRFYNAPIGYEEILKQNYGDYLKMPPIEKRVSHHSFNVFFAEGERNDFKD